MFNLKKELLVGNFVLNFNFNTMKKYDVNILQEKLEKIQRF